MSNSIRSRFGTANRRTDNTLRILDQGAAVTALHNDLRSLRFTIADDEFESGRFGLTTRQAVTLLQRQNGLQTTGIADAPTLSALREAAQAYAERLRRARWRRSIRVLRRTPRLDLNSRAVRLPNSQLAQELDDRRVAALKQHVLDLFDQPSERVATAVNDLALDLDEVADLSVKDLVFNRVIPALMQDESLEAELFRLARREIDTDDETVSELTGLDQDARDDDNLREFVNRTRNAVLGDIAALNTNAISAIGDTDLSQSGDAIFRLVEEGAIRNTQADRLLFAADLARLTDDNFDAVRTLINDGVQEARELVNRNANDWLQFIERNAIEPPAGDTAEDFAAVLDKNIELAFPTAYALTRFTAPASGSTLGRINVLNRLPDIRGDIFIDDGIRDDIDLSALSDTEADDIRAELVELAQFANRHAGLGIREVLNDRSLDTSSKRRLISRRQNALAQAWNNHPDLDLHLAHFSPLADPTARAFSVELDDVEPEERPFVRGALMSIQRVLRLSDGYAEADRLMAAGLDDAVKIAGLDDADELAERTGLARPVALRIRARAIETRTRMLHVVQGIEETTGHAPFLPTTLHEAGGAGGAGTLTNVLQDLPGYDELFGPQNYCKCRHCQSIFGPAAYFVDLMRFIDQKISRRNFINPDLTSHPLYLRNRRDDLWTLPLTCGHTDTPVLYISIVNEVLENYLETADPLDGDIWENLATEARSSFQQPFNLPHAGMLLYLEHLGVGLEEVWSLFDADRQAATHARLGISAQELATLSTADPDAVRQRFAKPFTQDLAEHDTHVLTKLTRVSREMLGRLLETDFVLGNVRIQTEITSETNDLVGFVEHLRLEVSNDAEHEGSLRALLDRLHRLTRLQRVFEWTPEELQIAISALGANQNLLSDVLQFGEVLNDDLLAALADLRQLMHRLDLSVSEAIALCQQIPEASPGPDSESLWRQLFGTHEQLEVRHPGLGNTEPDHEPGQTGVSPGFGILQGALRISEPDLIDLLRCELSTTLIDSGNIGQDHLNQLYRAARMAQALDFSQDAYAAFSRIVPNLGEDVGARVRLAAQIEAMDIIGSLKDIDLPFDQLLPHFDGMRTAAADIAYATELLDQLHETLRNTESLWLTPAALSQIEGITPESARAIIQHLLNTESWLIQPDATRERYILTDAVSLDEDSSLLEALSASGGPLQEAGTDDHAAGFLTEALRHQLQQQLPRHLAATAIAAGLNLSADTLQAFDSLFADADPLSHENIGLADWLGFTSNPPSATLLAYVAGLVRIRALLVNTLNASDDAIRFIAAHPELFDISPLSLNDAAPPAAGWNWMTLWRLASFVDLLRAAGNGSEATLFRMLDGWNGTSFAASTLPDLAWLYDVTTGQIEALLSELPVDEDVFRALRRIKDGVALTRRTGLDPTSLHQLVAQTFAQAASAQALVLGAMRTKYPTEQAWHALNDTFNEKIEMLKRDALVDRILSRPELGFDNTGDIYQFLLLDIKVDGCLRTSRIKNAISACQLYMQRCLMGLEKSQETNLHPAIQVKVKQGRKTREEWTWRKSYRVWEANRKVFLYPENYLLPDLRDDRSHIFKATESDLLQGNLDDSAIEKVFQRYLAEFVQVGDIQVVHTLYEKGDYLFFGRTLQEPYRYFMRRFNGKGHWEPWEPIDLDISAKTISAVTRNSKPRLFWINVVSGDANKVRDAQPDIDPDELANDGAEPVNDQSQETLPITVSYVTRNESGVWSQPQDFVYYNLLLWSKGREENRLLPISDRIYAEFKHPSGSINQSNSGVENLIRLIHPVGSPDRGGANNDLSSLRQYLGFLRENDNTTIRRNGKTTHALGDKRTFVNRWEFTTPGLMYEVNVRGLVTTWKNPSGSTAEIDYFINDGFPDIPDEIFPGDSKNVIIFNGIDPARIRLAAVQQNTLEVVLHAGDLQYLLKKTREPDINLSDVDPNVIHSPFLSSVLQLMLAERKLLPLTTHYPKRLSETFFTQGLEQLLSPEQQYEPEPLAIQSGMSFERLRELKPPDEDFAGSETARALAQFNGVHGNYLWEIHCHLPFLIAHTLNSIGKFEQADHWYRYIFDPTTADDGSNAHWRFVVFRTLKQPKLRDILSDRAAIRKYKKDPFNPFAIARLRPSAFQKTIVMRYIDNLLDWGDERFRTDTRESINEAMLLYIMAADLLGERPIETGECEVAESFTFTDIQQRGSGSNFLIELENLVYFYVNLGAFLPVNKTDPDLDFTIPGLPDHGDSQPGEPPAPGSAFVARSNAAANFQPYTLVHERVASAFVSGQDEDGDTPLNGSSNFAFQPDQPPEPDPPFEPEYDLTANEADEPDLDGSILDSRQLGFCMPPNDTLLGYWDRVEDRLFKLRHCMNIEGVVRELPLWQPPIDPLLLVRAKAAGLELDDVLALVNEQPPHHRFEVLLERARRFTSTAQQFGSQLLSALERKDESELTLLRSVHEDTILNLVRSQKQDAIAEARESLEHLKRTEEATQTRLDHYDHLIGSDETETPAGSDEYAMIQEEKMALDEMQSSKDEQEAAGSAESKAQRYRELGPQWTTGGSFGAGILWDGRPTGSYFRLTGDSQFSWGSANIEARFQRRAFRHRDASSRHSAAAGMASTTAGHLRRLAEWKLQRKLARKELAALQPQIAAADIRIALAEKDLETHDQQIDNSRELYDFAKDRFTNLGLYSYLSTTLSRLYREAYDMALKMAQVAERAYRFEIGEDSFFIKLDNWIASRAGLLAADRLLLQLQAMEAAYAERDRRRQEVTLPCALSQINPDALVRLRNAGRAEFSIPEWWFDLHYPGQYRRMLQAVRMTVPCVTGPYNNVCAKLTLVNSEIRATASPAANALVGVQIGRNSSISTSSAKSDPGVFELHFDGPKNPPFKGAGAVSSWVLELPATSRVFDYSTIADAILEFSYTAEDDGLLRDAVVGANDEPGLMDVQLQNDRVRIISLRHEFPDIFHNLLTANAETSGPMDIPLSRSRLFPFWLGNRNIQITQIAISLEPESGHQIASSSLQDSAEVVVNSESLSGWFDDANLGGLATVSASPAQAIELGDETAPVSIMASLPEDVAVRDMLVRLTYNAN